jgi:hypothetical protein
LRFLEPKCSSKEVSHVARKKSLVPLVSGRLSLVETGLGESPDSGRRMEQSTVLPTANYRMFKRENLADQNRVPRFRSGLSLGEFSREKRSSRSAWWGPTTRKALNDVFYSIW